MIELKPGAGPAMSFSVGAATLTYYLWPQLEAAQAAGLNEVVGIGALAAVITPIAVAGKAGLKRLTTKIEGAEKKAPEKD